MDSAPSADRDLQGSDHLRELLPYLRERSRVEEGHNSIFLPDLKGIFPEAHLVHALGYALIPIPQMCKLDGDLTFIAEHMVGHEESSSSERERTDHVALPINDDAHFLQGKPTTDIEGRGGLIPSHRGQNSRLDRPQHYSPSSQVGQGHHWPIPSLLLQALLQFGFPGGGFTAN
jgi:hypothetical protein